MLYSKLISNKEKSYRKFYTYFIILQVFAVSVKWFHYIAKPWLLANYLELLSWKHFKKQPPPEWWINLLLYIKLYYFFKFFCSYPSCLWFVWPKSIVRTSIQKCRLFSLPFRLSSSFISCTAVLSLRVTPWTLLEWSWINITYGWSRYGISSFTLACRVDFKFRYVLFDLKPVHFYLKITERADTIQVSLVDFRLVFSEK